MHSVSKEEFKPFERSQHDFRQTLTLALHGIRKAHKKNNRAFVQEAGIITVNFPSSFLAHVLPMQPQLIA